MKDREYREGERPENLLRELGYETQDINYRQLAKSGVVLFGFFFATTVFVWLIIMWGFFPTRLEGGKRATAAERRLPPAGTPMLQTNITAKTDIKDLRIKETKILEKPAYDQKRNAYTIPVERAIDLLAERGLPKGPAVAPVASGGPGG